MTAAELAAAPSPGRVRAIRISAVYCAVGPILAAGYVLGTWGSPYRSLMLAIVGFVLAVPALGWWQACAIARSRARVPLQLLGVMVSVAGSAALGVLDGGVASPLGELIPFSLIFFAILVPPRVFAAVGLLSLLAYWTVVLFGGPAPPGYPFTHALGFGMIACLCLRHARVLASLRRRLAELSRIDPLTRCLNRRGFDERLERHLAGAARTGEPVTLVLVDLDRFKEINDAYGHQAGDEILAWAGHTLTGQLRAQDATGRIGGDEFAVLLADTGPAGAEVHVERLRAAIQGPAPASFGYASFPADASTVTALTHIADERLYADKAARDRRIPSADAVAVARSRVERHAPVVVSRRERRRNSIADVGRMTAMKGLIGLLYAAFFAVGHPNRLGIAALSVLGGSLGLAFLLAAGWLSRSPMARTVISALAVVFFTVTASVTSLDGGVSAPTGVALLIEMPLLALGTRARAVVPALGGASLLYLGVAVFAGASSGWYVATHLAGAVTVSLACALQGWNAARQRALVTRLSSVDALTGCLNRRGFEDRFTAARSGALLILDLDGFKQLNDSCGHAAGDELLRWVGQTLRDSVRPDDAVGRLGGDEFVVLAGAGADATAVADRVRAALAVRTPASIGVAVLGRDGDNFDSLYASADARLYAEKARRRSARAGLAAPTDAWL